MKKKTIFFGRSIETGKHITWSLIGEIDGNDLYLCDTVLSEGIYGETNDYMLSMARKKCMYFYETFLTDDERARLICHPEFGDAVFLLSKEEYLKHKYAIKPVSSRWWLRSPGIYPYSAAGVDSGGGVTDDYVLYAYLGLRPAILLKKEN